MIRFPIRLRGHKVLWGSEGKIRLNFINSPEGKNNKTFTNKVLVTQCQIGKLAIPYAYFIIFYIYHNCRSVFLHNIYN